MYFVGLDLAWGERNPTGVAVVDDKGALVNISAQTDDASILAAIRPYVADDCVVGIDAPLIVTNPTGNRPCEAALNKDFAKFQAGAHPANQSKPEFADGALDFHRFVLLVTHSFSDRIRFVSELELEHALRAPRTGARHGAEVFFHRERLEDVALLRHPA